MTFGSDGATAIEPIEEMGWSSKIGFQRSAAVGRLPDAAGRGGGVVGERIAGDAGHARHAPAGGRTDQPVLEGRELLGTAPGSLVLIRAKGAAPGVDPPHEKARHDRHIAPSTHPFSPHGPTHPPEPGAYPVGGGPSTASG